MWLIRIQQVALFPGVGKRVVVYVRGRGTLVDSPNKKNTKRQPTEMLRLHNAVNTALSFTHTQLLGHVHLLFCLHLSRFLQRFMARWGTTKIHFEYVFFFPVGNLNHTQLFGEACSYM